MAEQRPYRAPGAAAARLRQVKKYAAATLGLSFLVVNWMTTQHAAWLMGDLAAIRSGAIRAALVWPDLRAVEMDGVGLEMARHRADAAAVDEQRP